MNENSDEEGGAASQEYYFYSLGRTLISMSRITNLNVRTLIIVGQPITNLDGIETLTNLSELWVVESSLKDATQVSTCTHLKKLYLYSNQLTKFPELKPLKRLNTLWISGNSLDSIAENIPKELRELNLADNNISHIDSLRRCHKLETLNLAGNNIRRLNDIDILIPLTKLQSLIFADQMYEATPVTSLINYRSYIVRKMPQLKSLDYFKIEEEERESAKMYYNRKMRYYNMACSMAWNKYFNEKNQEILKSFNDMRALKKRHYINALTAAEKEKDWKLKEECKKLRQLLDSAAFNWECNHGRCNEALDKNLEIKLNLLELELQHFGNVHFIEHSEDSKLLSILEECLETYLCPSLKRQINLESVKVDKVIHIAHTNHNSYDRLQSIFEIEQNASLEDRFLILNSPVAVVDLEEWPFEFIQNYLAPKAGSQKHCTITNSIGIADKEWLTANGIYKNILLTNEKKQGHRVLIFAYVLTPAALECCSQEELGVSHVSDKVEQREPCTICKLYKTNLWENSFPIFVTHYHYEYKIKFDFEKDSSRLDIPSGAIYENSPTFSSVMESTKFETVSWHGLISLTLSKCRLSSFGPVTPIHSIKRLDITYNKLTSLQEVFRIFPNLEGLHASFNEITSVNNLMEMHRLEELDLQWNRLSLLLVALQNLNKACPNLTSLNMSYNAFKDVYDQKHIQYFVYKFFPTLRKFNNEWLGSENIMSCYKLSMKDLPMAYLSESTMNRIKQPIKLSWSGPLCLKHSDFRTTSHIAINEQRELTCVYIEKYKCFHDFQIDSPKGSIRWLTIKNNQLTNLKFLSMMHKLKEVDVSFNLLQKVGDSFAGLRYLVKLNLMGNYITTLEGFKGIDLPQLKVLNVSKNNIKSFYGIESFLTIEELYASSNDIRKWEVMEFTKTWKMLRIVDLCDNNINDPSMLRKFLIFHGPKIEYVNGVAICEQDITAATNTLSGLLDKDYLHKLYKPQELMHMTELTIKKVGLRQISVSSLATMNLTSLNLERNALSTLSPLSHLKSLKTVCLSFNQISRYGDSAEDFDQLEVLYLNFNNITDLNPLELNRCPKLTTLFLQDNQITSLDGLRDNTTLVNLVLDRNKLTEISVNDFLSFFNLRDLYLESNQIKDLSFLRSLKNLKRLFIGFNRIQDQETLDNLQHVPKLKELTFIGNPLCRLNSHYVAIFNVLPRLSYIDGFYIDDQLK
ncbi:leucine-rich repeat-containing protein 9-like isoform X2 [Cimex lectularius]|uniref:U2A'/phosphoprotein 32 family A C-terminal domain-containing protein n=1 Tax=Cimex lectularius TaxID=79782 RepID=A0A8I6TMX6_CIMLE|nr:leucine-rich repeat-containing protein 9-like isoform X2 [Cimex lectularius]